MNNHADSDNTDANQSTTRDDDHLADVEPGAGCTEIWEHLSERRNDASDVQTEE